MNKLQLIALSVFSALLVLGLVTQRHAIACEMVGFTEYQQLAPNVYAAAHFDESASALAAIRQGKARVESTFGPMRATPKIVLVADRQEAARFGANSTATANYTPFGTCIVLAEHGQNVDVAAHELVHAEVGARVGWLTHWVAIPIWFNEGVALMVDHRAPFLVENIRLGAAEVAAVKRLTYGNEFFRGGNAHQNYLASRLAVQTVEPLELYQHLERIRNGQSFESVFRL
ncbi:hypothetical protein [uncultured Ferrimonas sp.]|uniref:hypothetical protein n=1 Tax=uncultured Ferrimonas sp. TaxID=432640 RepID=UPI00262C6032|nr:hypothetical protein [uncultured Ferrimonas sp.]